MKKAKYVKRGFWAKIRETMADIEFVEEAVALYFCATDHRTPVWVKVAAFAALAYFITPLDLMPDPIYLDDAGVIAQAFAMVQSFVTAEHRRKASDWITGGRLEVA